MNTNSQEQHTEKASRGGCLTTWLILIIVANAAILMLNIVNYSDLVNHGATPNQGVFIVAILTDIVAIVGAVALFFFKRFGGYLLVGAIVVTILFNLFSGGFAFISSIVGGIIGISILLWLLNREGRWERFFT